MPAQVYISLNAQNPPSEFLINTGQDGRSLQEVINGACMLSGAEFPEIQRIDVNGNGANDWTQTIINGDRITISIKQATEEVKDDSKEEENQVDTPDSKQEQEEPAEAAAIDTEAETTEVKEKIIEKVITVPADLTASKEALSKLREQIECLKQDSEVLDERLKHVTDAISSSRKVVSAIAEHISTFEDVYVECVKNVKDASTQPKLS